MVPPGGHDSIQLGGTETVSDRTQAPASSQTTVTRRRQKTTTEWVAGKNGKFPWRTGAVLMGGGLLAALLILASTMWAVPHIEDRLTAETRADLETAGIDPDALTIDYDYRDGSISGELAAGFAATDAQGAVDFDGIRTLGVNLTSAPEPEPEAAPPESVVGRTLGNASDMEEALPGVR